MNWNVLEQLANPTKSEFSLMRHNTESLMLSSQYGAKYLEI